MRSPSRGTRHCAQRSPKMPDAPSPRARRLTALASRARAASASATVASFGQLHIPAASAVAASHSDQAALRSRSGAVMCPAVRAPRCTNASTSDAAVCSNSGSKQRRRQRIGEREAHVELDAAAVVADGRERPLAVELAEWARHELMRDARCRGSSVLRVVNSALQRAAAARRCVATISRSRARHRRARCVHPGTNCGIALDVVDQREHAARAAARPAPSA